MKSMFWPALLLKCLLFAQVLESVVASPVRSLLAQSQSMSMSESESTDGTDVGDGSTNTPVATWIAIGVGIGLIVVCICGAVIWKTRQTY